MGRLNWGGLAIGAIAGLGLAAALSLMVFALGIRFGESAGGDIAFAAIQLAALIGAGYVAGRFSPGPPANQTTHGAMSALLLFAVSAFIGLAAGSDLAIFAIVGGGVVALVLGSVGGVLSVNR